MTKKIPSVLLVISLYGCSAASPVKQEDYKGASSQQPVAQTQNICAGTNGLPIEYAGAFDEVVDEALLSRAVGDASKGGLCQGKVYSSKKDVIVPVYRAWNSTNPNSRFGKWWAFNLPDGKIAQYRSDYEICYQYSSLDKLTHCKLKANTKVVVGTGQSAMCDAYLTYPISTAKQIYVEIDAQSPSVIDCKDYDGLFNWKLVTDSRP